MDHAFIEDNITFEKGGEIFVNDDFCSLRIQNCSAYESTRIFFNKGTHQLDRIQFNLLVHLCTELLHNAGVKFVQTQELDSTVGIFENIRRTAANPK